MSFFGAPGGAAATANQHVAFFEKVGPTSYATGGFVIDLSATFSSLNDVCLIPKKGSRGTLGAGNLRYQLNTPTAGKVTVVVRKHQHTRVSTIDNITAGSQPTGVTVQAASGAASSSESSHTHAIDHDHASVTSATPTASGAAVNSALTTLNKMLGSHTHTVDIPAFTGTSAAGSAHSHVDNNIYAHTHTDTQTDTNPTSTEVANATDLSATVWYGMASGVRK